MKELTIKLPDDLFDKLDSIQNKGAFVRKLIEKEINSPGKDRASSNQSSDQLRNEIKSLNERVKQMGYKIDNINSMLSATTNVGRSEIQEMRTQIEVENEESGEKEELESEQNLASKSPFDTEELERNILMYIPPGSQIKDDVVRNLLSKKYEFAQIENQVKRMVEAGTILKVTKDGSSYLLRT